MMQQLNLFFRAKKKKPVPKKDEFVFIGYRVSIMRRAYQRSIGLTVKPSGLIRVTAGKSVPHAEIWNFLEEQKNWIKKAQDEFAKLRNNNPQKKFVRGEKFLFMGQKKELQFLSWDKNKYKFEIIKNYLVCRVSNAEWKKAADFKELPQVEKAFMKFYKDEGVKHLKDRVAHFAKEMDLYPSALSFRQQKSRWGSCGSNGHISLNWKLIAAPLEVIDYVVVHELAHLRHQNHSKRFWALVEKHCAQWKSHKKWLTDHQFQFDFLAKKSELYQP